MLHCNSTISLADFARANPAFRVRDCEFHMKDLQSPINENDVSSDSVRQEVFQFWPRASSRKLAQS